jgi:large subunit ribosomal protein L15
MVEKKTPGKTPRGKKAAPAPRAKAAPAAPKTRAAKPAKAAAEAAEPRAPRKAAAAERPSLPPALGIHDLAPASGATHYRKRVGRGPGSGHGKTAGRGYKGQKSRTGYRHLRGFEGGQMPLHRRVPKRGFTNIFRVEYEVVNLADLDRFPAGEKITPDTLAAARLSRRDRPVKILGDGQVGKALNVAAHKFSAGARTKIEAAGGSCEVLPR